VEETAINRIEWHAPEYDHQEKSPDFLWTVGIAAGVVCILALWFHNYVFAIFVLISGVCLIFFSTREPHIMHFIIDNEGINLGRDTHPWKTITGFNLIEHDSRTKLIILTTKRFMPMYTIPLPNELSQEIKESLLKKVPLIELEESASMKFMEKLGF
jgi:hypothetical protein